MYGLSVGIVSLPRGRENEGVGRYSKRRLKFCRLWQHTVEVVEVGCGDT